MKTIQIAPPDSVNDGIEVDDFDGPEPLLRTFNECGHNCTEVRLRFIVDWVVKHRPDLLPSH